MAPCPPRGMTDLRERERVRLADPRAQQRPRLQHQQHQSQHQQQRHHQNYHQALQQQAKAAQQDWSDWALRTSGESASGSDHSPTREPVNNTHAPVDRRTGLTGPRPAQQTHTNPLSVKPTIQTAMGEFALKVLNLPYSWRAKHLIDKFSRYGIVVYAYVKSKPDGSSCREGKVVFDPPPNLEFWNTAFRVTGDNGKPCFLGFQRWHENSQKQSGGTVEVEADRISIGILQGETTMLEMFNTRSFLKKEHRPGPGHCFCPITATIIPEYHEFSIKFPVHYVDPNPAPNLSRTDVLRIVFTLRQRLQILRCKHPGRDDVEILAFNSDLVPRVYRKTEPDGNNPFVWSEKDCFFRQTDIVLDPRSETLMTRPASLRRDESRVNIGRWNAYLLMIKIPDQAHREQLAKFLQTLQNFNVDVQEVERVAIKDGNNIRPVWDILDPHPDETDNSLSALLDKGPLEWNVRYQLEVCISGGWLNEYTLNEKWIDGLRKMPPMEACALLEYVATDRSEQKKRRIDDPFEVFDWHPPKSSVLTIKPPAGKIIVRSATVTPTTIIFNTPSLEITNRIVRKYKHLADRFLRIRFLDEREMGRIYGRSGKRSDDELYTRIKRVLNRGVFVADRHYDLLAWGNSQFRENGAYFFSNCSEANVEGIRRWMGDFSNIKVIAKYAARIGQCFSTTRAVEGTPLRLSDIPDVKRNGFEFTDGVGKISAMVASSAQKTFTIDTPIDRLPSAYQFRLGGYKGVLAVWPDVKGFNVQLRPSQNKFTVVKGELEIIRHSSATLFSLNRQLIMVLSSLGIKTEVFLDKASQQLARVHEAMINPDVARDALRSGVDANQMTTMLADMVAAGFHSSKDPFLMSLLHLWRAWTIKYLKEKARINIADGAVVIGVSDEEVVLKGHFDHLQHKLNSTNPDERIEAVPEVFLQLSNYKGTGEQKVVTGLMLLARNPSLHAGDIRVVKGVDHPKLHHLRDVVVLPQTGDRDLSSMCSGGDLDGDDYLVCWDKELIPPEWNVPAMDFTPPKPSTKDNVNMDDLTTFFVRYMKNAELGQIAHYHLATADISPVGVKDEKCISLAELHSHAVDYPKAGIPAVVPDNLKVKKWPHYMKKKNWYRSESALGLLYDSVKREDFVPPYDNPFDDRVLQACPTKPEHETAAIEIKALYDDALRRLMQQHSIKTEFEVWSTFVMEYSRDMGEYKFAEVLGQDVGAIKEQFAEMCREKAGCGRILNGTSEGGNTEDGEGEYLTPFVVAMYKVTRDQVSDALYECDNHRLDQDGNILPMRVKTPGSMPFMSFPWLFPHILTRIARNVSAFNNVGLAGLPVFNSSTDIQVIEGAQAAATITAPMGPLASEFTGAGTLADPIIVSDKQDDGKFPDSGNSLFTDSATKDSSLARDWKHGAMEPSGSSGHMQAFNNAVGQASNTFYKSVSPQLLETKLSVDPVDSTHEEPENMSEQETSNSNESSSFANGEGVSDELDSSDEDVIMIGDDEGPSAMDQLHSLL